jgi:hypothetical protein
VTRHEWPPGAGSVWIVDSEREESCPFCATIAKRVLGVLVVVGLVVLAVLYIWTVGVAR